MYSFVDLIRMFEVHFAFIKNSARLKSEILQKTMYQENFLISYIFLVPAVMAQGQSQCLVSSGPMFDFWQVGTVPTQHIEEFL